MIKIFKLNIKIFVFQKSIGIIDKQAHMYQFEINSYIYVDKKTRNKFNILARNVEFADKLAERISNLGVFNLRRAKIRFCRKMVTEIGPYEIEKEQLKNVEEWEENAKKKTHDGE